MNKPKKIIIVILTRPVHKPLLARTFQSLNSVRQPTVTVPCSFWLYPGCLRAYPRGYGHPHLLRYQRRRLSPTSELLAAARIFARTTEVVMSRLNSGCCSKRHASATVSTPCSSKINRSSSVRCVLSPAACSHSRSLGSSDLGRLLDNLCQLPG